MNADRYRLLALAVTFALALSRGFAQEAVEIKPEESVEPKAIEQKAAPEDTAKRDETKTEEKTRRDIQDVMTAEEFKAAGLDKLSEDELKKLNGWLQGYRQTAETKAAERATAEVTKKSSGAARAVDGLLSRVDGTFTGLTGHTVIKLEDGTTWKQANVEDRFRAQVTDRPPVKVSHGPFGYKMRVVGTGEFYVDPVRN